MLLLSKLLKGDERTLSVIRTNLVVNGFCFIKIDSNSDTLSKVLSYNTKLFNSTLKKQLSLTYDVGYSETAFKHHMRFITGDYSYPKVNHKAIDPLEKEYAHVMTKFSGQMDAVMKKITLYLNKYVFKLTKSQGDKLSLFGEPKAGLLDIVTYKPNQTREFYVSEHVDPGLFSLNVLSSASGMQFYSRKEHKWIEMPAGYGAIFCGQAATTLCNIPAARHRVVNNKIGRSTIWYEVGLVDQVPPKHKLTVKEAKPPSSPFNTKLLTVKVAGEKRFILVPKNGTIKDLKKGIENTDGIPMSKSMSSPLQVEKLLKEERERMAKPFVKPQPVYQKKFSQSLNRFFGDDAKLGDSTSWELRNGFLHPKN